MDVLRQTDDGMMAARIVLTAPGKASFTLIAMRHIAEPAFHRTVGDDLEAHHAVLREGGPVAESPGPGPYPAAGGHSDGSARRPDRADDMAPRAPLTTGTVLSRA